MTRLLLVEDDKALRTGLVDALGGEGHEVVVAPDGFDGMRQVKEEPFDLVILDLMLPGPSGLEILKELRARDATTPVLLLTAKGDEADKVLGLELGADDYVTKPFGLRELLARVRALLRRVAVGREEERVTQFAIGKAAVDLGAFQVERKGEALALSPKEAGMLGLLWERRGQVVSRQTFLRLVWGSEKFVGNRTVDTHVLNLRQKIEEDPRRPRYLVTVHGAGYRLDV